MVGILEDQGPEVGPLVFNHGRLLHLVLAEQSLVILRHELTPIMEKVVASNLSLQGSSRGVGDF